MEQIFNLVLMTSLYASVVGVMILLLKRVLKDRINAGWQYLLWTVLLLKLMIPYGPESAFSLFNTVPVQQAHTQMAAIASQVAPLPLQTGIAGAPTPSVSSGTDQQNTHMTAAETSTISVVWALGAALFLSWLLFTNYSLHRRLKRSAFTDDHERLEKILALCKSKLHVKSNIRIIMQDVITTPSLFGVIRPKILLSPAIANIADKEIEYILLHELAHYKRKDMLVNYFLLFFQVLHWFNPVMWYCFRRIHQDMEVATDEKVLRVLENYEHKEYGKALLAVLERCNTPRLAPRLVGMVDDRKNMERRIRMLKMAEFFKRKKRIVFITGILCMVLLSSILLTSGKTSGSEDKTREYDAKTLLDYKSLYIGDASNVSNLLQRLPLGEYKVKIALSTKEQPYGLTVEYGAAIMDKYSESDTARWMISNMAVVFSLIDNVDVIQCNIQGEEAWQYHYTRSTLQTYFDRDVREFTGDKKVFASFLASLGSIPWPEAARGEQSLMLPADLDEAVSLAVKEQSSSYLTGEMVVEGHVIRYLHSGVGILNTVLYK